MRNKIYSTSSFSSPFLPIPIVHTMPTCCTLPAIVRDSSSYLTLSLYLLCQHNGFHNLKQKCQQQFLIKESSHSPFVAVSASSAVSAPNTTSYASSNISQTLPKNPVDRYGKGHHCGPHLGSTARHLYCCCIFIIPASVVESWSYRNCTGPD